MKRDTLLDYAEFQLTPRRTRCELLVSADGLMEKLASGFVKPFITHLRAAEVQVARGNQVIRLEVTAGYEKHSLHQQNDNGWFCKGTVERFVRFVSTPEVIERVKTIEDEVTQLEQVRSALVNTFAQTTDRFPYDDVNSGHQRSRDGSNSLVPRRFSTDKEDSEPDASKKELLRAMEARLSALHQEQSVAFSRANAAGFDNDNISDLMTFAEHFGADRLHDACAHFLALSCKKTVANGGQECTHSPSFKTPDDVPSCTSTSAFGPKVGTKEEAWLHGTKRKLDFGANKLQATKSGTGVETNEIDPAKRDSGQKGGSTVINTDQTPEGSMFFARLQQMAQQVDARSSEDFGWQMDEEKNELPPQASQNDPDNSSRASHSNPSLTERSTSLPALRVRTEGSSSRLWGPSSVESGTSKAEEEASKGNESSRNPEENPGMEIDKSNNQSSQGDAPTRRLSVQAAISLFESKKKDSNDPPFRKLTKQESRKTLIESCSSPSEKSVLRRWSVQSPRSPAANSAQEKKVADMGGLDTHQEPEWVKVKGDVNNISSSQKGVDVPPPQPTSDEQARENFKKSLNTLLQLDNTQHLERNSKFQHINAETQDMKHSFPPIQQPSNSTGKSSLRSDFKSLSSADQNVSINKMDPQILLKSESEPVATATPVKVNLQKKPATEVKSDNQPVLTRAGIDHNAQLDQEHVEKEMPKIRNVKEFLPKPTESSSHRSKIASQVSGVASLEQQKAEPMPTVAPQAEQVLGRRIETLKAKEAPAIDSRQAGRNASSGKILVQKKTSSVKEAPTNLLSSSVDFHMQALVQMVEQQCTNVSFNSVATSNERKGEERGRFYDHYSKLRDAKLRGEHPAKRAEKEAKLKSMQETLERRKAEMETKSASVSRRKIRDARATDQGVERSAQSMSLPVALAEQKDLKDEEDDTDQEEYSLKTQDQILDYSNPTSPTSTPRSSKIRSSSLKLRTPNRTVPTLSKSVSSSQSSARGGASSPKSTPKNPGRAPSQGKSSNLSTSSVDTTAVKTLFNTKDVSRSPLIRTGGSARVHPRVNVPPSEAATLVDDLNNPTTPGNTDRKETKHQSLVTRKSVASIAVSRSLSTDTGILLGSPKDQQDGATEVIDGRAPQNSGATLEAKPFLRKGRGIGPGAGPGIMKQKASILADTSKNSEEDTSAQSKQEEAFVDSEDIKSTAEEPLKVFDAEEASTIQDENSSSTSYVETVLPTAANDEVASLSSRPSTGPTESGDVEPSDSLPGSASENEKPGPGNNASHEKLQEIGSGVAESAPQVSLIQAVDHKKQKEDTFILSDLLSQRNLEPVNNNAGHVTSSISFREASLLPHGHIGSPFPASVPHPYSSMLQRGAVSNRFSPPRVDLPPSSPATWNVSQSSKYMQEPELVNSSRRLSGNQKQASMLPLPPKEPSKGFKRLLHFGRKSRTSEMTTDCVSVSTTSEGDDDADEVRESGSQLSDDMLQKARMQKRGFEYGNMGDQYNYADQDTSQFFGSSIPPPPANFKLREEHLTGGNLIKGPRSFFSLSSFRSKGSEGKSR